jgi:hypothetical protein
MTTLAYDAFLVDYAMAVPKCFEDALAKKRFKPGDIIYSDKRGYLPLWSEAIRYVSYAVQVTQMHGDKIEYVILTKEGNGLVRYKSLIQPVDKFIEDLRLGLEV